PSKQELFKLTKGVQDEKDLLKVKGYKVVSIDKRKQTMILQLTLLEGKNRHIHRMMEKLGYPVMKLKREKYGFITLGKLQPGAARALTHEEVHQLKFLARKNVKQSTNLSN